MTKSTGDLWAALLDESIAVRHAMRTAIVEPLDAAVDAVVHAVERGGKVLLLGNGGSAADAQHVAAELVGRFKLERPAWPAVALTENVASLTSISNDYGYEVVFARQLQGLAAPGDVVIALSTSGTSPSVVRALDMAGELGLTRIAITRAEANPSADRAEIPVRVPAPTTAAVQEATMLFLHALCELCERRLTDGDAP